MSKFLVKPQIYTLRMDRKYVNTYKCEKKKKSHTPLLVFNKTYSSSCIRNFSKLLKHKDSEFVQMFPQNHILTVFFPLNSTT